MKARCLGWLSTGLDGTTHGVVRSLCNYLRISSLPGTNCGNRLLFAYFRSRFGPRRGRPLVKQVSGIVAPLTAQDHHSGAAPTMRRSRCRGRRDWFTTVPEVAEACWHGGVRKSPTTRNKSNSRPLGRRRMRDNSRPSDVRNQRTKTDRPNQWDPYQDQRSPRLRRRRCGSRSG